MFGSFSKVFEEDTIVFSQLKIAFFESLFLQGFVPEILLNSSLYNF